MNFRYSQKTYPHPIFSCQKVQVFYGVFKTFLDFLGEFWHNISHRLKEEPWEQKMP